MKIPRSTLSLAAEYAVASELCRRSIYAQLTFGYQKRTDILVFNLKTNKMLRIEVKAKQGNSFPNCRGIFGGNVILVLVDFQNKKLGEQPDFYILTEEDWINFVKAEITKNPDVEIKIDEENCPVWVQQITKSGKPYKGMGIKPDQIQIHKECWDKIEKELS